MDNYDGLKFGKKISIGMKLKLLNKIAAAPDEYYSMTPPDPQWMKDHGKRFWLQPSKEQLNNLDILT